MPKSGSSQQRCPCGAHRFSTGGAPRVAVCLQLSTVRETPRRRAPAITLYPCDECIRLIHTKRGRALRRALAIALQGMHVILSRQKKAA
jgi:hypothetical protein